MVKKEEEGKEVLFEDVLEYIHKCQDLTALRKIEKLVAGAIVYLNDVKYNF